MFLINPLIIAMADLPCCLVASLRLYHVEASAQQAQIAESSNGQSGLTLDKALELF
jgi:hypothetical protein